MKTRLRYEPVTGYRARPSVAKMVDMLPVYNQPPARKVTASEEWLRLLRTAQARPSRLFEQDESKLLPETPNALERGPIHDHSAHKYPTTQDDAYPIHRI